MLVHLADHPDLKDGKDVREERKALIAAEKEVKQNLEILEKLKPRINKRYERYTQLMRERQSRMSSSAAVSPAASSQPSPPPDPALSGVAEPLEAGKDNELAVKLARTEISRRATVRNAMRQGGLSGGDESSRRAAGIWGDWEEALQRNERRDPDDLSRRIQEVRLNLEGRPQISSKSVTRPLADVSSTPTYKYPTVPRQKALDVPSVPVEIPKTEAREFTKPPVLPPKESFKTSQPSGLELPPRPDKISQAVPPASAAAVPTKVAADDKRKGLDPSSFTFKPSAYLENGTPLRTVFLPPQLRSHFLSLAASNTRKNLETCGILCGTLISNALFISRLLIPEQISTSDTCETVNESAIFEYCDSEDLIVLGWIHTHPTQTCFMSSRDLHTHCGYQVMLPESIAIVCAPSQTPNWGVFRLTDPPGLKSVLSCTQTGLFHPHAETNLYTNALRPGHVFEANGLEFETVDQRVSKS